MENKLRVVVIDDAPVWTDGHRYAMPVAMNRFYEQLARELGPVVVCGPTKRTASAELGRGYVSDNTLVGYVERPYYDSPVALLATRPWAILLSVRPLWRAIGRADVVYIQVPSIVAPLAYLLAALRRRRTVVEVKGSWDASVDERFGRLARPIGRAVVRLLRAVDDRAARGKLTLVHTTEDQERLTRKGGRVHLVAVSSVSEQQIVRRDDTPQGSPLRVLYVGRVSPAKGLGYALQALHELDDPRLLLSIVGDGPALSRLREDVASLGLEAQVSFEGTLSYGEELMDAYRRSDLFLLPSVTEGIPKVLFEAMAAGLPIIATSVGGIPQVITDGANGLLIEPRRPDQIREAIVRLATDGRLRRKLIANGYETVASYTLEATARRIAGLLRAG